MISFSWHIARALVRKRGSVGPWYEGLVPVMLVAGEPEARQAQSARRILAQMDLDARGTIDVWPREASPSEPASGPNSLAVRAWQVESAAGDVLGVVFASTQERAADPSAWGGQGFTLSEIVVELGEPRPHDPRGSHRVSVRVGAQLAFSELWIQRGANGALEHGDYMSWATWTGLNVDSGFQRAVKRLVEFALARAGAAAAGNVGSEVCSDALA